METKARNCLERSQYAREKISRGNEPLFATVLRWCLTVSSAYDRAASFSRSLSLSLSLSLSVSWITSGHPATQDLTYHVDARLTKTSLE